MIVFCRLLKLEVKIRQKALEDPSFPSADIIAEFLKENENLKSQKFSWERPSLAKFLVSVAIIFLILESLKPSSHFEFYVRYYQNLC